MSKINWSERVPMLSINPHAATPEDVSRLAACRMSTWSKIRDYLIDVLDMEKSQAVTAAKEICNRIDEESVEL